MWLRILLFISALRLGCSFPRTVVKNLTVNNGGPWGDWLRPSFCAADAFAIGYDMKVEPNLGPNTDDSALNSIWLHCARRNTGEFAADVHTGVAPWGHWRGHTDCNTPDGVQHFLYKFQLQVETWRGSGDDSAANYIKFRCRDFDASRPSFELAAGEGHGLWGEFGSWSPSCPLGSAVCGIQGKVEVPQGGGDDTALNDVKLFCCT